MPQETSQQPFAGDQHRSKADQELVSQILGEEAAVEMEELSGKIADNKTNSTPTSDLELTAAESDATQKVEQAVPPEIRRQEYHMWAEEEGYSIGWVNGSFKFNNDGTVEHLHSLSFLKPVERIPDSLKMIHGNLDLSKTRWDEIPRELQNTKIKGRLMIQKDDAQDLPSGINCEELVIYDTDTSSIPATQIQNELIKKGYSNIRIVTKER